MKIILLADIHSNFDALFSIMNDFRKYDAIFCLGDLIGYGAEPNQVVETIRMLEPRVVIAGNHEYAVVTGDVSRFHTAHGIKAIEWTRKHLKKENLRFISRFPNFFSLKINEMKIGVYHGSPRDPINEYVFPITPVSTLKSLVRLAKTDVLLLGHSHIPFHFAFDSKLILNPGSVGQPRDGDARASYAVLEIGVGKVSYSVHRVRYDVDSAADKILKNHLPRILADRLFFGF
jgi:putative phosphoesterase